MYHILCMTRCVKLEKQKMQEMSELTEDVFLNPDLLGVDYYRKLKLVILEFEKREWLVD